MIPAYKGKSGISLVFASQKEMYAEKVQKIKAEKNCVSVNFVQVGKLCHEKEF